MLPEDFKLTDSSYANPHTFSSSPWSEIFKNDIRVSDCVFFIGYSLFDLDIKRILYISSIIKDKVFFITSKKPNEVVQVKLKQYGNIVPVGVEMFSQMVSSRKVSFSPTTIPWNPTCFKKSIKPKFTGKKLRDDDMFNLLTLGQSDPEFIFQELTNTSQPKYYIKRTGLDKILHHFDASAPTDIIIHSDLGNGKSLLIDGLQYLLLDKGYAVFNLIDKSDLFERDFDMILKMSGRKIVIIDKYVHWFSAIEHMAKLRNPNLYFIFVERSAVHDVNFKHLSKHVDLDACLEIDLNILTNTELEQIVNLMDLYGLWGSNSHLPADRKKSLLCDSHRSQMQSILLNIIQSEDIANRLSKIVTIINTNQTYTEVVLTVLILDSLGIMTTIDVVMNLLETDLLNSSSFRKNPQIRELIDMDTFQIHAKSAVTAKYLLNSIENPSILINTLIKLTRNASNLSHNREIYYAILRDLMNYSNIQGVLPSTGKLDNCISFYETVKDLPQARFNPHFWLQYAIARMAIKDYQKAGTYFDTSYALIRKKENYDTYQIDNHFARYLLEKQIEKGTPASAMAAFRDAHKIIRQQSYDGKENRFYPYRVACIYFDFFHVYKNTLTTNEKEEFYLNCTELKKNIDTLTERTQRHYVIKDFIKKVDSIIPQ